MSNENIKHTRCKFCGELVEVDTSVVCACKPPKYSIHCHHCDNVYYEFCHETIFEEEKIIKFKAFEILKDKSVNIRFLKFCFTKGRRALTLYNNSNLSDRKLTKEEFELLQEVL